MKDLKNVMYFFCKQLILTEPTKPKAPSKTAIFITILFLK